MTAPFLSRDDIEQIAQKILSIYSDAYVPKNHMFYTVEPELLAEVFRDCNRLSDAFSGWLHPGRDLTG